MSEAHKISMQGLSGKRFQRLTRGRREQRRLCLEACPVEVVAEERVPDRGEMDADLVRTPGLEPAGKEAGHRLAAAAAVALEHFPMGDRLAAIRAHGHP